MDAAFTVAFHCDISV